ncbi:hypothetical protein ACQ4LE_008676 [Meloidogyne hapla]|uniref:C2H2-type domain-containing protein n=1 Tax=Meloidogyne hapla TaxID=6305 RepID=A0A1I8BZ53_MELHA
MEQYSDHAGYYNYNSQAPQSSKLSGQKTQEEENVVFEELLFGQIVIREDGQICVQVQGDVKDLSFSESDSIKFIENNGEQTIFIEKRTEHDYCEQKAFSRGDERQTKEDRSQQDDNHQLAAFQNPNNQFVLNEEEVVALDNIDFTGCGEEIVTTTPTTENINLNLNNRKQHKRVFGSNKCLECGQSFTNLARLERHLAVHQCLGAYICPLCGKTYKYEYNLFYHWRRTCRDLNEMMTVEERKAIEINALRHLIEDISKKHSFNALDYSKQQSTSFYTKELQNQQTMQESFHNGQNSFPNDFVLVQDGHDYNNPNLHSFTSNLPQSQFSGENLGEIYSEERTTDSRDTSLTSPYTFTNQSNVVNQSSQFNKSTRALQCTECLRSFSSLQRLQKHMTGSHYSTGRHPCLFCGNRFKYEYNLFFHYRNVCPYSLDLLNEETRRRLDASNLKKLIRRIATDRNFYLKSPPSNIQNRQTDEPGTSSSSLLTQLIANPSENGDSAMRRQMMKKIIRKYVPKSRQKFNSIKNGKDGEELNNSQCNIELPPVLLQPAYRPDLPEGIHCPICSVVFYGLKIIILHLKAAHPKESSIWEKTIKGLDNSSNKNNKLISHSKINPKLFLTFSSNSVNYLNKKRNLEEHYNFNEDHPPLLEIEQ